LELDPLYVEAWNSKGVAYGLFKKYYEDSIICFDHAIDIDPDDDRAWFLKAKTLSAMGDLGNALECYDRSLEIKPNKQRSMVTGEVWFYTILKYSPHQ